MRKSAQKFEAIVIGVSSGGFETLPNVLKGFPKEFSLPIIIVHHTAPYTDNSFYIKHLIEKCGLTVKEVEEKESIVRGIVYIAPPNYHILVELDKTFSLSADDKISFSRPSVDVLFETAAEAYRKKLIGILLTGANSDGVNGLRTIKKFNGTTIAQDPKTCSSTMMPQCAIDAGVIDYILEPQDIYTKINFLLKDTLRY